MGLKKKRGPPDPFFLVFTTLRPGVICSREQSEFEKTDNWHTVDCALKDVVLEVACPR